jgi:formate/nitrite transporter
MTPASAADQGDADRVTFDALLPDAMARKAEAIGAGKAAMPAVQTLVLAVLAGAFIALGAAFSTAVSTGAETSIGYGPSRFLAGIAFCLGLVLVVVAGAELFTGNTMLVMAWTARRVTARALLRNWAIVYGGNLIGAVGTAVLVYGSGQYRSAQGAVGDQALRTAAAKAGLGVDEAILRGILANALVCLAVWLCYSARSVTDKVLAIVLPITAFVAMGFEHSVANMYFLPVGLFIDAGAPDAFWSETGLSSDAFEHLTWTDALVQNLAPVTLGNIIGGGGFVGLVYAFVYLQPRRS